MKRILMIMMVLGVIMSGSIAFSEGWETNMKMGSTPQTIDLITDLSSVTEVINVTSVDTVDTVTSITNTVTTLEVLSTDAEGLGVAIVGTTAIELAFTGDTKTIFISSVTGNTGQLYVGESTVTDAGVGAIYVLNMNEKISFDYDDTSNALYVVSSVTPTSYIAGAILQ